MVHPVPFIANLFAMSSFKLSTGVGGSNWVWEHGGATPPPPPQRPVQTFKPIESQLGRWWLSRGKGRGENAEVTRAPAALATPGALTLHS